MSALTLAVAWVLVLAGYAFYAVNSQPQVWGVAAAAIVLLIGAASFLYAWREPGA